MKNIVEMPVLLVVSNYSLSYSQDSSFREKFGLAEEKPKGWVSEEEAYNNGDTMDSTYTEYRAKIVRSLSSMRADEEFSLPEAKRLARAIIGEAIGNGATHIFIEGNALLSMWVNIYASNYGEQSIDLGYLAHIMEIKRGHRYYGEESFKITPVQPINNGWVEMF